MTNLLDDRIKRGKLIVFEGGESVGKTTVINALIQYLTEQGVNFKYFREPGGCHASEDIRSVIFKHSISVETEAMLFAAARAELMSTQIIPLLDAGVHVILDRFIMSSLCYQGYVRKMGIDTVLSLNKIAIKDYFPDMNILLDMDPEKALSRLEGADREVNRFDMAALDFHHEVRAGYLHLAKRFSDTFTIVNADRSSKEVSEDSIRIVLDNLS